MKTIETYGKIEDGSLKRFNETLYRQKIKDIGNASDVKITIEYGNKRTVNQNAYLFGGVLDPICYYLRQQGWEELTPYRLYKKIENIYSVEEIVNHETGEVQEITIPLKEQDSETFWDIVERVVQWGRNKGITIEWPWEFYGMTEIEYHNMKLGNAAWFCTPKTKAVGWPRRGLFNLNQKQVICGKLVEKAGS